MAPTYAFMSVLAAALSVTISLVSGVVVFAAITVLWTVRWLTMDPIVVRDRPRR